MNVLVNVMLKAMDYQWQIKAENDTMKYAFQKITEVGMNKEAFKAMQ